MKALSGRQPWWWLLLHGKGIENRRWNTRYRGPILLHAAKGCTRREYDEAVAFVRERFGSERADAIPRLADLPRGGIVGRACIVDVIRPTRPDSIRIDHDVAYDIAGRHRVEFHWWMQDQYGFVLKDAEELPFVACDGRLGLFDVEPTLSVRARQIVLFP